MVSEGIEKSDVLWFCVFEVVQLLKSQEVVVRRFCDYVEETIMQQLRETIHSPLYNSYEPA